MRKRMYCRGKKIRTISRFEKVVQGGTGKYVWCFNKPVHPGWAASWQYRMIIHAIKVGILYEAKLNN